MVLISIISASGTFLYRGLSQQDHSTRHGHLGSLGLNRLRVVTPNGAQLDAFGAGKRQSLQVLMLKDAVSGQRSGMPGFGQQRAGIKIKHKIISLDPTKVENVQRFELFAQKGGHGEPLLKWQPIGDILLEKGSDLEIALKERRKKLLAAAQHQYPSLALLSLGEEVLYGFREAIEGSDNEEITALNIKGKEPDVSVPALLRVDDGTKPPPKSSVLRPRV